MVAAGRPECGALLNEQYLNGIRLFNQGEYWHAHEAWEDCWREATGSDAIFFKGIIQAAAALVHWQRGNPTGLQRNWRKSYAKLTTLPPVMHGIVLETLIRDMEAFVQAGGIDGSVPRLVYLPNGASE